MKCRKWKRVLGLLLAAVLICTSLTGCSKESAGESGEGIGGGKDGQGEEESARGRFLEEELSVGGKFDYVFDMRKLENGNLRLIAMAGVNPAVWELSDDGKNNLNKLCDFPEELRTSAIGAVQRAALSPDGQIICEFVEFGADNLLHSVLYLIDEEGKANQILFELPELEEDKN